MAMNFKHVEEQIAELHEIYSEATYPTHTHLSTEPRYECEYCGYADVAPNCHEANCIAIKSEMTANTMQALLDRNKELEAALTEGEKWKERCESLASFNPNWDMLEATQESLREHMLRIKELEAILDDARSALHESYRTFGYSHEQSALMVSQALSAGEGRNKLQDALAKLQEQK
jgi:hypothetical protein